MHKMFFSIRHKDICKHNMKGKPPRSMPAKFYTGKALSIHYIRCWGLIWEREKYSSTVQKLHYPTHNRGKSNTKCKWLEESTDCRKRHFYILTLQVHATVQRLGALSPNSVTHRPPHDHHLYRSASYKRFKPIFPKSGPWSKGQAWCIIVNNLSRRRWVYFDRVLLAPDIHSPSMLKYTILSHKVPSHFVYD